MWIFFCRVLLILFCGILPLLVQVARNFEYEYSLILSYVLILVFPLLDLLLLRKNSASSALKNLYWFFIGILLLALPSAAGFAFGACKCSPTGFLIWYLMLVPTAWILALFFSTFYHAKLQEKTASFQKVVSFHLAFNFAIFLVLIVLLYVFPQKRLNGLFYGFLHGPVYDYLIEVDAEIVAARCVYFAISALLLFFVSKKKAANYRPLIFVFLGLLSVNYIFQHYSSLGVGQSLLQSRLSDTIEGEGFILYYKEAQSKKSLYQTLAKEAEFHIKELRQSLKMTKHPVIGIYVYPDARRKKLWFGGGGTDVADVFTPSIHINIESLPHSSLRHELVHALSSEFAFGGLGFHPNMALTEGLANVLAPRMRYVGVHDSAQALLKKYPETNLARLFGFGFWLEAGAQSYTLAESFLSYLQDKFGPEALLAIYSGDSLSQVTKKSMQENLHSWSRYLNESTFEQNLSAYANTLYHSRGVFGDVCPHSRADLSVSNPDWSIRLRQPIHWEAKKDFMNWQRTIDPNIKTGRVDEIRSQFRRYLQQKMSESSCNELLNDLEQIIQWLPKNLDDVYTKLLMFDVQAQCGFDEAMNQTLIALNEEAKKAFWGTRLMYSVYFREQLIEQKIADAKLWLLYAGNNTSKAPIEIDSFDNIVRLPFFLKYLLLIKGDLKLKSRSASASASAIKSEIEKILNVETDPNLHLSVLIDWWTRIGLLFYEQNNFPAAAQSFSKAEKIAPIAAKPYLSELTRLAQSLQN